VEVYNGLYYHNCRRFLVDSIGGVSGSVSQTGVVAIGRGVGSAGGKTVTGSITKSGTGAET